MKKICYIITLISIVTVFSCKESYLEVSDPDSLTSDVFPTTMEHMDLLMTAIYADQHSLGLFGMYMYPGGSYCLDHTWDLAWRSYQYWNDLCQNETKSDNIYMYYAWRDLWRGVQHCNNLLSVLPDFKEKYATTQTELDALSQMEGETLFMRAWFYYYLINFWGESFIIDGENGDKMGVQIITEVATTVSEMYTARSTVQEVWNLIINDLTQSEALLTSYPPSDKSRANAWAAKAFLGKAYVYTSNWSEAKTTLKDVIDNSGKSLVSFDIYKTMFNGKNEFNSESLFEINVSESTSTWGAWGASVGSSLGMIIAPTYMSDGGGANGSGWSNGYVHDKNLERFGFKLPMYTFVSNPAYDATKDVSVDNLDVICDPSYLAQSKALRDNKTVDPRLWVGCLQPYLDSMTVSGSRRAIVHYKDAPTTEKAWSLRKYVKLDGTEYEAFVNNGSNFYWLRLADVYLLYAEACINTGDDVTGLEYINKVHRRAYGYDVNTVSSIDYSSLSAETLASDDVLKNDPLKYERYAELYGEGNWWFDICRWKIGDKEAAYYENAAGGNISWQDDTDYAQPIPQTEMETNKAMIQNPGY
jgi:starch-binding outer membrane protein, SusD/RagB family